MKDLLIEVKPRESFGKNESRRMRRAGMIPAILYGADKDPVPLIVDPDAIEQILQSEAGANSLFRLGLAGTEKQRHVMIKDYQVDPVKGSLMHADFVRIRMDQLIEVSVPVRIIGEAVGVKVDGGILEHVTRSVEISSLPTAIPEHIDLDVTNLKIGDSIKVSDVQATAQYTMLTDQGQTLVICAAPAKEETTEEAAAEVDEAAAKSEPEVLKKGKADSTQEDKESK